MGSRGERGRVDIVLVILGVAAIVVAGVILRARSKPRWVEVSRSPGHRPEPTVRAHAMLRRSGIRARLRSTSAGSGWLIRGSAALGYSLLVREEDEQEARRLLQSGQNG